MATQTGPRRVPLTQLVYECDGCGACCRHHYIEVPISDAMREPRLAEAIVFNADHERYDDERHGFGPATKLVLNTTGPSGRIGGHDYGPCRFLEGDKCGIYATRPQVCAEYPAGGWACQSRRKRAGLLPLEPRGPAATRAERIGAFVRVSNDPTEQEAAEVKRAELREGTRNT